MHQYYSAIHRCYFDIPLRPPITHSIRSVNKTHKMPSLLSLMTEIAPSRPPSPGIEPKSPISPISKTKPEHLVPFHALIQDYRRAPILPRLHPLGYVPLNILSEMLAFNKYRMEYLDDEPVFQFFPVRTAKPQDVVLMNVKCVAFTEEVAKGGVKGMTKAMDELTWFMRGRGAIPLQRCRWFLPLLDSPSRQGRLIAKSTGKTPWPCLLTLTPASLTPDLASAPTASPCPPRVTWHCVCCAPSCPASTPCSSACMSSVCCLQPSQ